MAVGEPLGKLREQLLGVAAEYQKLADGVGSPDCGKRHPLAGTSPVAACGSQRPAPGGPERAVRLESR
jgi:hypothetical protein